MEADDVYGSGLRSADWTALRDVIWPFLHADDPAMVSISISISESLPRHLHHHPVIWLICKYQETGEDKYLDEAGRYLIPTSEPFGWYVPLTK